jgi:hypothetical protein
MGGLADLWRRGCSLLQPRLAVQMLSLQIDVTMFVSINTLQIAMYTYCTFVASHLQCRISLIAL